jgi:hypothetical protein
MSEGQFDDGHPEPDDQRDGRDIYARPASLRSGRKIDVTNASRQVTRRCELMLASNLPTRDRGRRWAAMVIGITTFNRA